MQTAFNCQIPLSSFRFEYFRSFLVAVLLEIATSIKYATTTTSTTPTTHLLFFLLTFQSSLPFGTQSHIITASPRTPTHVYAVVTFLIERKTRFSFPCCQVLFNKTVEYPSLQHGGYHTAPVHRVGDELSNRQTFVKGKKRHFSSKKFPDWLCGPQNPLINGYRPSLPQG